MYIERYKIIPYRDGDWAIQETELIDVTTHADLGISDGYRKYAPGLKEIIFTGTLQECEAKLKLIK